MNAESILWIYKAKIDSQFLATPMMTTRASSEDTIVVITISHLKLLRGWSPQPLFPLASIPTRWWQEASS